MKKILGSKNPADMLTKVVVLPMLHPEKFVKLGIDPPRGVLCYGPSGTGKTLLARAVANRTDACFIHFIGSELVQKYVGEGARIIRELFQKACIVFFDETDVIGGARFDDGVGGDNEVKRTMLEIINQLDGFDARGNIKVLMTTNRPDTLDPALLRPGRLDRKGEFGLPDLECRMQMFKIHTRTMNCDRDIRFEFLARLCPNSTGADIRSVCTAAGMYAIRARRKTVTEKDFLDAVNKVIKGYQKFSATTKATAYGAIVIMLKLGTPFPFQRPAREEILAFGEWGHVDVEEVVELPMLHPEKFVKLGIDPPRGVLCYGPPGMSKTLLARAVANKTDACFIRLIGSELVQKYVGEGARIIHELFQMARSKKACIVFFDEIDAIGGARFDDGVGGDNEVKRTMLEIINQLGGFDARGNIKVLMMRNRPDTLDPALLRPGRLDRKVEFGLPDLESRTQMFKIHTRTMNYERDIRFEFLARLCPNSTGADIRSVCTAAGMYAIRARRKTITERDFLDAVNKFIKGYQKFSATTKYMVYN
ncbi:hypothetical protein AgCh_034454 [Apium graveolens]